MSTKLLAATALFVSSAASAAPPVDARRVTGNVSADHAARPLTDACRVTGNLLTPGAKSGLEETCLLRMTGTRAELPLALTDTSEPNQCVASGLKVLRDGREFCSISLVPPSKKPEDDPKVEVPLTPEGV
ncbi:MAG: hypothetical protein R3F61_12455 [Myxococcota bacterium]